MNDKINNVEKPLPDMIMGMNLDHIFPDRLEAIRDVLVYRTWESGKTPIIAQAIGFQSEKMAERKGRQGKLPKGVVKIYGIHLDEGSPVLTEIAAIDPGCTVNWIKDRDVVKKKEAWECAGDYVESDIIECENRNCITHAEKGRRKYHIVSKGHPLRARCHYCEREFSVRYK